MTSPPGELEIVLETSRCRILGGVIVRADPRVWITQQLLDILHDGGAPLLADFTCAGPPACPAGDVITIHDSIGQRVLYQVTGPGPHAGLYEARWPD